MKVAYNTCYGGFGLSNIALTELAKKKGIELAWYEQTGYKHEGSESYKRLDGTPANDSMDVCPLTKDCGDVITELPNDLQYYQDFHDNNRSDPDLIEVIERLGEKANGYLGSLAIKEIPDGADFEITEYDGMEDVKPPRADW